MATTAVRPESILKDLQRQWVDLAHDEAKSGGVLRACAMTLLVAARDQNDALDARQVVGLLMRVHPSRAIIVYRGASGGGPDVAKVDLDARVFAECWKPFGKAQQICSEGVEIIAGSGGYAEVAHFLVPLRVPDLPVALWCRGSTIPEGGGIHHLYPLADKIIFDTEKAPDADSTLRSLRRLHAYGMRVADLHWGRITGWREIVSHLFNQGMLRVNEIRTVRITYGEGSVTTGARYIEAWFRSSLPTARITIEPEYSPDQLLNTITMSTPKGDLTVSRVDSTTLSVEGRGLSYQTHRAVVTEASLMQDELSILGPDPIYERVLNA
jgi:glucose-6-phosphate dehydrogenase assembly protein OpcA